MKNKVDYHIHTNYSDGALEPEEIVDLFKKLEYDVIAITDHDTISGFVPAFERGQQVGLRVIPAIEFSTFFEEDNPLEIHILGYNIDIYNEELLSVVKDLQVKKALRSEKVIASLRNLGIDIDKDSILDKSPHGYIGKPNIASEIVSKGYAPSIDDVFDSEKFFRHPNILKIEDAKISSKEAIDIINKSGGLAVIAHPGKLKVNAEKGTKEFYKEVASIIKRLKKMGLGGVECYHKSHRVRDEEEFSSIAESQRLHISRGSDFHGLSETDFELI